MGPTSTNIHGNVLFPEDCSHWVYTGSSYFYGSGAIKLNIAGNVVVNGSIDADAQKDKVYTTSAGGSVWITANSISGTGTISADGNRGEKTDGPLGAGSGGRVAIYTTLALAMATNSVTAFGEGWKYSSPLCSGAGTVFLKASSQTYGTLIVSTPVVSREYGLAPYFPTALSGTTPVPAGQTWTFDAVILGGLGRLSVEKGATLVLPNGLASVSASDTNRLSSIRIEPGAILTLPAGKQTISTGWFFHPATPLTINGDVDVLAGGAIGVPKTYQSETNYPGAYLTVLGNLLVDSTSLLSATEGICMTSSSDLIGGAHGGRAGKNTTTNLTYDSILNPSLSGSSSAQGFYGAGILDLDVSGCLTLNGKAESAGMGRDNTSTYAGGYASPGGTINLTLGSLAGSGIISAIGGGSSFYYNGSGGGGRIAIRLTESGSSFAPFGRTNILSSGRTGYYTSYDRSSSAGTVYLETAENGTDSGLIIIRNDGVTNNIISTPLPGKGTRCDAATVLQKASVSIENGAFADLTSSFKMTSVSLSQKGTLDLAGYTITLREMTIEGVKVAPGSHPASFFASGVIDSSVGKTGQVVIFNSTTVIIIK